MIRLTGGVSRPLRGREGEAMEVERPRTLRTRIVRLFALERTEISRTRHTSRFAYLLRRKFALTWHLRVKVNYRHAGYGECGRVDFPVYFFAA